MHIGKIAVLLAITGAFGIGCSSEPDAFDNDSSGSDTIAPEELGSSSESLSVRRRRACASSTQCGPKAYCTVEDGVCNPPPGCRPGMTCATLCYGVCAPRRDAGVGTPCGPNTCAPGLECCNASCGICTPKGGVCTQQVCEPSEDAGGCGGEPIMCGGIAGLPCPAGQKCIDDPRDDCDPRSGGADCSGICVSATNPCERPDRKYVSRDPRQCALILFICGPGLKPFSDRCGCGCEPVDAVTAQ